MKIFQGKLSLILIISSFHFITAFIFYNFDSQAQDSLIQVRFEDFLIVNLMIIIINSFVLFQVYFHDFLKVFS